MGIRTLPASQTSTHAKPDARHSTGTVNEPALPAPVDCTLFKPRTEVSKDRAAAVAAAKSLALHATASPTHGSAAPGATLRHPRTMMEHRDFSKVNARNFESKIGKDPAFLSALGDLMSPHRDYKLMSARKADANVFIVRVAIGQPLDGAPAAEQEFRVNLLPSAIGGPLKLRLDPLGAPRVSTIASARPNEVALAKAEMTTIESLFASRLRDQPGIFGELAQRAIGALNQIIVKQTSETQAQVRGRFTDALGEPTILNGALQTADLARLGLANVVGAVMERADKPVVSGKIDPAPQSMKAPSLNRYRDNADIRQGILDPWAEWYGAEMSVLAFSIPEFRDSIHRIMQRFLTEHQMKSAFFGEMVTTGPGEYRLRVEIPNFFDGKPPLDWAIAVRVSGSPQAPHFELESLGEPQLRTGSQAQLPTGSIARHRMSDAEARAAALLASTPQLAGDLAKQILGDLTNLVAKQRPDGNFDVQATFENPYTERTHRASLVASNTGRILS